MKLNESVMLERMGGDLAIVEQLARMFCEDMQSEYLQPLDSALQAQDWVELRRHVHSLKSVLSTFGDDEGSAQAQDFEARLVAGDVTDASATTQKLQQNIKAVAQALSERFGAG